MAAKKVSAKKAPAKPRSSGGSRDYDDKVSKAKATNRALADRGQAVQRSLSRANSDIGVSIIRGNRNALTNKAGKDARSRASKYGSPISPTQVDDVPSQVERPYFRGRGDSIITATTRVKVPGGYLDVVEKKVQRGGGRDKKLSTTVSGVANKKSKSGDLGAQRATQRAKKKKK